jgi:hypothetical protein
MSNSGKNWRLILSHISLIFYFVKGHITNHPCFLDILNQIVLVTFLTETRADVGLLVFQIFLLRFIPDDLSCSFTLLIIYKKTSLKYSVILTCFFWKCSVTLTWRDRIQYTRCLYIYTLAVLSFIFSLRFSLAYSESYCYLIIHNSYWN